MFTALVEKNDRIEGISAGSVLSSQSPDFFAQVVLANA